MADDLDDTDDSRPCNSCGAPAETTGRDGQALCEECQRHIEAERRSPGPAVL